ncbi:DNRLRE domain-containing protein [Clostridium thermarum]|uniref:glycoside hydrolase family 78 protein n=1 Tax=Clostridium thermarum TaxID=1716543 RepID=UPI00111F6E2C|nr:DNRLRE domain-containing protein [Clostridium thermarum]
MAQYTVEVPITESTFVDRNNPNTNYGNLSYLNLYKDRYYALIKFELPVPVRKRIVSAKLMMYVVNGGGYKLSSWAGDHRGEWSENTVTFNQINTDGSFSGLTHTLINDEYNEFAHVNPSGNNILKVQPPTGYGYEDAEIEIVQVHSTRGENAPYIILIYEDVPPSKPTLIDPIGVYRDNQSSLRFSWKYNSSVGGVQKAFDFEWSTDGATWNTVSETTSNNYYDMPDNTLPGGNIYWRVRCYNEYDEVSAYSDTSAFYCIGASPVPVIETISPNTSRPVISWASSQQQIYQIQILNGENVIYDSGNIPGILERSHKIKAFLEDGTYTAKVRVKNEYDIWSAWGERQFEVSTTKPNKPSFAVYNRDYGLQLHISPVASIAYYLIYRSEYSKEEYICIGKTDNVIFDDNTVANNQDYKYFVRAVTTDEAYQDSNVKVGTAYFKHSLIAPITDLNNIFVMKHGFNRKPARSLSRIQKGEVSYFNGRKHGVAEFSEHIESGIALEFAFKTYNEVEQFLEIYDLAETVLYRDSKGRKIYGTLNGLSEREEQSVYIISFTISETDYTEEVDI